mgnify:CR=1 FL=1
MPQIIRISTTAIPRVSSFAFLFSLKVPDKTIMEEAGEQASLENEPTTAKWQKEAGENLAAAEIDLPRQMSEMRGYWEAGNMEASSSSFCSSSLLSSCAFSSSAISETVTLCSWEASAYSIISSCSIHKAVSVYIGKKRGNEMQIWGLHRPAA